MRFDARETPEKTWSAGNLLFYQDDLALGVTGQCPEDGVSYYMKEGRPDAYCTGGVHVLLGDKSTDDTNFRLGFAAQSKLLCLEGRRMSCSDRSKNFARKLA